VSIFYLRVMRISTLRLTLFVVARVVVMSPQARFGHSAETDLEKDAVKTLKKGKPFLETTEDNMYRRAGPIALTNHCLKCHVPDRKSTKIRTAGLIISVPLTTESK